MRKALLFSVFWVFCFSPFSALAGSDVLFEMDNPLTSEGWSGKKNTYNYGHNYLYTRCSSTTSATSYVVFDSNSSAYGIITATSTGPYSVYVRWVSRPNSTADAHYLIYDGTPTLFSEPAASCTINQTSRTGEWIYCGTATLTQGNNAYVVLGNDCEPNKEVVADAIRFVKQKTSLAFKGEWSNGTTYGLDDVASYNGSSYVSLIDPNTGNQPDISTTAWTLLAQTGAAGPQGPQGTRHSRGYRRYGTSRTTRRYRTTGASRSPRSPRRNRSCREYRSGPQPNPNSAFALVLFKLQFFGYHSWQPAPCFCL